MGDLEILEMLEILLTWVFKALCFLLVFNANRYLCELIGKIREEKGKNKSAISEVLKKNWGEIDESYKMMIEKQNGYNNDMSERHTDD